MLDVARLKSLLDTREAHLADAAAAKKDKLAASTRMLSAESSIRDVEASLNAAIPDALPRLVEAAELLRELLPCVDHGAVGHHAVTGCRCAMCDAMALVGQPSAAAPVVEPETAHDPRFPRPHQILPCRIEEVPDAERVEPGPEAEQDDAIAKLLRWMSVVGLRTPLEFVECEDAKRVFPVGGHSQLDVNRVSRWLVGAEVPDLFWATRIAELTGGEVPVSAWSEGR